MKISLLFFTIITFDRFAIAMFNFSFMAVIYPELFSPILGKYGFLQVVRSSEYLSNMEISYKQYLATNSKDIGFFRWYFEKREYFDQLKTLIAIKYLSFTPTQIQMMFLIFSPGPVILDKEMYIPWHLLKHYLIKHELLHIDIRDMEVTFYPNVFFSSTFPEILIPQVKILRIIVAGIGKLRIAKPNEKSAELHLILKETLNLLIKFCQLADKKGEMKAFLTKLNYLISMEFIYKHRNLNWGTMFPKLNNLLQKHAVRPLEMHKELVELCKKGRRAFVFESLSTAMPAAIAAIWLYGFYTWLL